MRGVVRGHVETAAGVLRDRLVEPWTLSMLAEEVHLSRSQLVRSFDATVSLSPMAHLRQMRVQRMARLLASTDLSVAEAARTVGWTDPFHASRCFHAAHGLAPTGFCPSPSGHSTPRPPFGRPRRARATGASGHCTADGRAAGQPGAPEKRQTSVTAGQAAGFSFARPCV